MLKIPVLFLLPFFTAISVQAQRNEDSIINKKLIFAPTPARPVITLPATFPANLSTQYLSFFCDKEYKLEKWTKIPFRFRLGSVEYCDKMEGKNR
ncbi:hypothetical protein FC093_09135 [Ilyomonas limi]|uniref:Uncharacterized protein n=1 Tax=Ilyomonas limi TaxID=2575867 RepID=A0A4U3L1U4_9BACT|nr:hypothetical protein [Ilyomonas limi]TKK68850.1 hypothetical protein FC093_09135 [Ilyomonas limi]